jgi:RNA ligase
MKPLRLQEIVDVELLERMIAEHYVKVTQDPRTGLSIYNYTARAQYSQEWNEATLSCRGLIVDAAGHVVARPFPKLFNHEPALVEGLTGAVEVTDKLDGSLGILYASGGTWRIATRGSFESEQAQHATALLHERHGEFQPVAGWTYLFEILYPRNRIVVDYRGRDELVLLGAVDIATGRSVALDAVRATWNGPVVDVLPYASVVDALAAAPRANAEGLVVHFLDHGVRVKIKQSDYVTLHRLVTGVSQRRVWEVLAQGDDLTEWLEAVPDEFYQFVTRTRDELLAAHAAATEGLHTEHRRILEGLRAEFGDDWTRRDLAAAVLSSEHPLAKGVFAIADGKDVTALIWMQLRPAEHVPFFQLDDH